VRVDVVPRVVVGGSDGANGASGSSIMEGLLTLLLSDKLGLQVGDGIKRDGNPEAERIRNDIRQSMLEKGEGDKTSKPASDVLPPITPTAPTKN
jgi:hypothetical protein